MITLTCPSCSGKSTVGDEFAGRKIKCPKCGTRVRHQSDGSFELLSVGRPPSFAPPAAAASEGKPSAAAASAGGAPPPSSPASPEPALELQPLPVAPPSVAPPKKESTVAIGLMTEVAGSLLTQGESKQNTYIAWGVVGFIAAALSIVGLVMRDPALAVAPVAVALAAAFVWLFVRAQKRKALGAKGRAAKPAKPAVKDDQKTEPLPKL